MAGAGGGCQSGERRRRGSGGSRLERGGNSNGPFRPRAIRARAEKRGGVIWDKAEDLGRMSGQTPEYKALRRAETALREDQDAQGKVDLIQKLARQMDELVAQGQM